MLGSVRQSNVSVPATAPRPMPTGAPTPTPKATAQASRFGQDNLALSPRQSRYKLEADLVASRIYVLDKATGEPVDRYLTSPGRAAFPTKGDHFVIQRTLLKATWTPPASAWAKDLKPVPGGPNNPMGIFKMELGAYSEFIHGTPPGERKDLGHPASHGCLRMSNENVLQLYEQYAGTGTEVEINRDPQISRQLKAAFDARGLSDHKITDGANLLPDAVAGQAPSPVGRR